MKAYLLQMPLLIAGWLLSNTAGAQTSLAPDQNPNFAISRDKYVKIADSLNEWHSTTIQDTYKAIDWIADRQAARADRREFRRDLRRYRSGWYGSPGYYNYNNGGYYRNNYRRNNYYPNYYRGGYRSYRYNNFWWNFFCL